MRRQGKDLGKEPGAERHFGDRRHNKPISRMPKEENVWPYYLTYLSTHISRFNNILWYHILNAEQFLEFHGVKRKSRDKLILGGKTNQSLNVESMIL